MDLFLAPSGYVDVASAGTLSALTGGSTFYFPRFNPTKHADSFTNELKRDVKKFFGFDGLMRVRTSAGLKVIEHYGNLYPKNETDISVAGFDSESGRPPFHLLEAFLHPSFSSTHLSFFPLLARLQQSAFTFSTKARSMTKMRLSFSARSSTPPCLA